MPETEEHHDEAKFIVTIGGGGGEEEVDSDAAAAAAAGDSSSIAVADTATKSDCTEKDCNTVSTEHENENGNDSDDGNPTDRILDGDDDDDGIMVHNQTPLFHYTRITSAGLPRQHNERSVSVSSGSGSGPFSPSACSCSKLTVIKIDPETLFTNNSAAASAAFAAAASANSFASDRNTSGTVDPANAGGGGARTGGAGVGVAGAGATGSSTVYDDAISNSLLLSSDLWGQPHTILACGWQNNNTITLTHIHAVGSTNSNNDIGTPVAIVDGHHHTHGGGGGGGSGATTIPVPNINAMMNLGGASVSDGGGGTQTSSVSSTTTTVGGTSTIIGAGTGGPSSKNINSPAATLKLYVRDTTEGGNAQRTSPPTPPPYSVVDMSFDASGTMLGAIDRSGTCTIWEFKYAATLQPKSLLFPPPSSSGEQAPTPVVPTIDANIASQQLTGIPTTTTPSTQNSAGNPNVFSNFMSALTGMPPTASDSVVDSGSPSRARTTSHPTTSSSTNSPSTANPRNGRVDSGAGAGSSRHSSTAYGLTPALTATVVHTNRVNYPASWGAPSCMVLDPSYKKKRDKSVLVGFENGKLVLTKRGTFFQRRNDTIVYQANNASMHKSGGGYRGIETVVWRGPLVAWADANGIKLLDMDTMTRIAHIDRPTGARISLYPTIRDMKPSLLFETSSSLLVAWGDCLMEMSVPEYPVGSASTGGNTSSMNTSLEGNEVKKRRTVECTMAWELDCVASDVVPLDAKHVAVLGLVPAQENDDAATNDATNEGAHRKNDVEVQVLSRDDGTILFCDFLPVLRSNDAALGQESNQPSSTDVRLSIDDSALSNRLLSTFALPRMDDLEETKAMRSEHGNSNAVVGVDVEFDFNQGIFSGNDITTSPQRVFKDPHMRWSIQSAVDNQISAEGPNDASSVDSDDYDFVNRPLSNIDANLHMELDANRSNSKSDLPPTMIVCTASDAVVSRVSTIDDSIEHALSLQKYALALRRGLLYKKKLRRFSLDELINQYLGAVLKISNVKRVVAASNDTTLSLRRMKVALDAMPVLFGGNINLWRKWAEQLEKIPGSLFLLQKNIPVRDPVLPSDLYTRILLTMLADVERIAKRSKNDKHATPDWTDQVATGCFLDTITAWGSTNVLREFIKLYRASRERCNSDHAVMRLKGAEISLQKRYLQTSAGYLIFPVRNGADETQVSQMPNEESSDDGSQDCLFDVSIVVSVIAPMVPLVNTSEDVSDVSKAAMLSSQDSLVPNNQACLEAMARLRMIQGRYDLALQCLLAIGAFHATEQLETFEIAAIDFVNGKGNDYQTESVISIETRSYDFVLDLIGTHHLHQFLLERDFLLATDSRLFVPLIALLRLVGLKRLGDFLIEHYVSPDYSYDFILSEDSGATKGWKIGSESRNVLRREPLPIDKVAEQFERSPALLHWYLHLVLTRRPDFYVKFPTNSVPGTTVTNLHRKHFQLYVDFAQEFRDSRAFLAGIEPYKVESQSTPLLTFLKAALPLGGVLPMDARRVLEIERSKSSKDDETSRDGNKNDSASDDHSSPVFALELAHLIEFYTEQTQAEAMGILNLYLRGIQSVVLAVFFVQRQKRLTSELWDTLTRFCINDEYSQSASDGMLFGDLLEAAALAGADLARLVKEIPEGIKVEGLRPRLVAAVADYRMKVEVYTAAISAGSEDEASLMREIAHRSRRGVRYLVGANRAKTAAEIIQMKRQEDEGEIAEKIIEELPTAMSKAIRTRARRDHNKLALSIPRR